MADWRAQRVVLKEVERDIRGAAAVQRVGGAAGQLGARDVHLQDVLVVRQVLAAVLAARRRLCGRLSQARHACCAARLLCCMDRGVARCVRTRSACMPIHRLVPAGARRA
jgi:hypothetical protein